MFPEALHLENWWTASMSGSRANSISIRSLRASMTTPMNATAGNPGPAFYFARPPTSASNYLRALWSETDGVTWRQASARAAERVSSIVVTTKGLPVPATFGSVHSLRHPELSWRNRIRYDFTQRTQGEDLRRWRG